MQQELALPSNAWPPPYTIRHSKRAKRIHLRISQTSGLEVVIPSFRKRFDIHTILTTRRDWIEKHWPNFQASQEQGKNCTANKLPTVLALNAIGEIWHISYIDATNEIQLLEKNNQHLTCYGALKAKSIQTLLIHWLKKYAHQYCAAKLENICRKTGLHYQKLTIRSQKTLWGSCNAKKNISLNFKLLFLPPAIFNYVLLHELCHTKYLNHSNKFWHLVAQYDQHYLTHDKVLKQADQYVPEWVLNF